MRNQRRIESRHGALPQTKNRKTVVIADDGLHASVVLLDGADRATEGSLFEHLGRRWIIRGHRHHSRVLVAEPLAEIQQ
jgi:hypothetical protein